MKYALKLLEELKVKSMSYEGVYRELYDELKGWSPQQVNQEREGDIDVIDFFSGCGGMSFGFSSLSQRFPVFNLKGAIDINEIALSSYNKNFNTKIFVEDIRNLIDDYSITEFRELFGLSTEKRKPLVVIGCAPCQGFTSHKKKTWNIEDERNTLIGAFADIATKLDPDYVVMENVPEILGKKYWHHYAEARDVFENSGYEVKQTIYNCADFGTPQSRFRAIVVASKKAFELPPPAFQKSEHVTVRNAISDLPFVKAGQVLAADKYHKSARHKESTIMTIKSVPHNGGNRPQGIGPKCLDKVSGFSDVYGRLYWDKPSITLTQYARNPASGRFTHPEQDRGLTIREAARIQGFPDGYEFQGSLDKCFKQIGESVPPQLSLAIAFQILLTESSFQTPMSELKTITVNEPVSSSFSSVIASLKAGI